MDDHTEQQRAELVLASDAMGAFFGWLQIVCAALMFGMLTYGLTRNAVPFRLVVSSIAFAGLVGLVGFMTLRKWKVGYWLTALNYFLQIPGFAIGSVVYGYCALAGLWLRISGDGKLGFGAGVGWHFKAVITRPVDTWVFTVDLLALFVFAGAAVALFGRYQKNG